MDIKEKTPSANSGPKASITTNDKVFRNGVNRDRQEWRDAFVTYQLDLFGSRVAELVERVRFGTLGFIDAVDMAYSAAIWSGLIDDVGDDLVQSTIAGAFMGLRR